MLTAIRQWVLRTMMKNQTGVMQTLPKKDLVDFNVQMTAELLARNGIDPNVLKNANQVENAVKQIEAPRVKEGITSIKSAKIMDMKGKEIDPRSKIMGGRQSETEAEIAARISKENKKAAQKIRDRKRLEDRALEDFVDDAGGVNLDDPRGIDDFIPDPEDMAQGGRAGFVAGGIPNLAARLARGFMKVTGRKPNDEEFMKIIREAAERDFAEVSDDVALRGVSETRAIARRMDSIDKDELQKVIDEYNIPVRTQEQFDFATGGRAGFANGGTQFELPFGKPDFFIGKGKNKKAIYKQKDGTSLVVPIGPDDLPSYSTGGRAGFKIGGIDKARRAFLKLMGGVGAGIGALKTGILGLGKGADAVKNLPPIKTPVTKLEGTTTQMPDWFPSFVNKFRNEGKAENVFKKEKVEVSKAEYDKAIAEGKGENYYRDDARTLEYKANNPDHMDFFKLEETDERIYTTYTNDKVPGVRVDDMDGNVDVMFENEYSQPVSLNYTAPGKKGPETGRVDEFVQGQAKMEPKPKGEFVANDVEVYATDPDGGSEAVDVIANTVDDMLEGTTRTMEEYVTGKKTKLSKGEGRMIEAEIRAEQAADAAAEAAADAADDFASGGIARMLGE